MHMYYVYDVLYIHDMSMIYMATDGACFTCSTTKSSRFWSDKGEPATPSIALKFSVLASKSNCGGSTHRYLNM